MKASDLLGHIFDDPRSVFALRFAGWLAESPRFKAFAELYRDKIRKKLRTARALEDRKDVELELEIAHLLLAERRFTLEYERYGIGKQRGPDFTATFRTRIPLNIEVTRMRATPEAPEAEPRNHIAKTAGVLCAKVGQMAPGIINVLVLATSAPTYDPEDLPRVLKLLRERGDQKDDDFFKRRGFTDARDFARQFPRLSAVVYLAPHTGNPAKASILWPNPQARHPLSSEIANALRPALIGDRERP